jgi:hypothetical protein
MQGTMLAQLHGSSVIAWENKRSQERIGGLANTHLHTPLLTPNQSQQLGSPVSSLDHRIGVKVVPFHNTIETRAHHVSSS